MRPILALFVLLTLAACSSAGSKSDADNPAKTASAEVMYNNAKKSLDKNNFESAVKELESLQSRYPYGPYAQQAQLDLAYAYYRQDDPESSVSAAESFIKQYPNSPYVDYAYYVKGLANFNSDIGAFALKFGQSPSERDPKAAQSSFAAFKDLVTRFPSSKYAPDSRVRMQYLVDLLARYDIHVAKYYLRRGANISAVNRAMDVLKNYPDAPSIKDALLVMVQAYDALGMDKLRDDAQRVLNMNFPGTASPAGKLSDSSQ